MSDMAIVRQSRDRHSIRKYDLKEALKSLLAKVKLLHDQWIDSRVIHLLLQHYQFIPSDLNHTTFVRQIANLIKSGVISTIESTLEPPNPSGWYHAKRRKKKTRMNFIPQ